MRIQQDIHSPDQDIKSMPATMAKLFEAFRKGEVVLHEQTVGGATHHRFTLAENPSAVVYMGPLMGTFPVFERYSQKNPGETSKTASSAYVFSPKKLADMRKLWNYACKCADSFNKLSGKLAVDVARMEPATLTVLKRLKSAGAVKMTGIVEPAATTICAMGLGSVTPDGYLKPSTLLAKTSVPKSIY